MSCNLLTIFFSRKLEWLTWKLSKALAPSCNWWPYWLVCAKSAKRMNHSKNKPTVKEFSLNLILCIMHVCYLFLTVHNWFIKAIFCYFSNFLWFVAAILLRSLMKKGLLWASKVSPNCFSEYVYWSSIILETASGKHSSVRTSWTKELAWTTTSLILASDSLFHHCLLFFSSFAWRVSSWTKCLCPAKS